MVKLFVGGFPLDMTELELVQLIARHGDVSTIKIVRDKKTRVCKGYAFVEMTDRKGAELAVEMLDGTPLGDRKLSISIKEDEPVAVKPAHVNIRRYDAPVKAKRPRRQ